jgi:hypothetical protein
MARLSFIPALQDNLGDRTVEMTSFDNVGNFIPGSDCAWL